MRHAALARTHTCMNTHTCTDQNHTGMGIHIFLSSLSLSLFFIPPLCTPTHHLIPSALRKSHRKCVSQEIFETLGCCGSALMIVHTIFFWLCQPVRQRHIATSKPHTEMHKCSHHVFMSRDAQTHRLPRLLPLHTQIYGIQRKYKDTQSQKLGEFIHTYIYTHLSG